MSHDSVLDLYLDEVRRIRAVKVGTAETSFYPAIGTLLNAVGQKLKPRVFCLHLLAYGLVLATNLWQFRLIGAKGAMLESFDLAADKAAFWALASGPRRDSLRERFAAFLQRCLLTSAPLARPSDVAFFLASYAREALARLAERAELPALGGLRKGMEDALGIRFDERDDHRVWAGRP